MKTFEEFKEWYLKQKRDCVVFKYDPEKLTNSQTECGRNCGNKMKTLVSIETSKLKNSIDSRGKNYLNINCCTNENCYDEMFQAEYSLTDDALGNSPLEIEYKTDYPAYSEIHEFEHVHNYICEIDDYSIINYIGTLHITDNKVGGWSSYDGNLYHPIDDGRGNCSYKSWKHILQFIPPGLSWGGVSIFDCDKCKTQFSYYINESFEE